jgi:hypothetical protein
MTTDEPERNRGALRRASRSVPTPLTVDATDWHREAGARTSGTFVRASKSVNLPVVVDAAEWLVPRLAAVTEELAVLLSALDADQRVQAVQALVTALNERHHLDLTLTPKTA